MESLGQILGKVSPVTNPPGPSPTSNREDTNCTTCGITFNALCVNGVPAYKTCPECRSKERQAQHLRDLQSQLPLTIENQRDLWWEQCGQRFRFMHKTFATFNAKLQPKAYQILHSYRLLESEPDNPQPNSVLLLSPDLFGVGKTHLLMALIAHIIETETPAYLYGTAIQKQRCPVFYTTETQLLARIRATFHHDPDSDSETEEQLYTYLENLSLLIVDDVGKVRPHDLSFLQSVYFRIIDARYNNLSPIIMASNLSPAELEAHIGGACADRLREMCGKNIVIMAGKSYRH